MTSESSEPTTAELSRDLVRIALPLVLSSGSTSLMHVVDRIFLTWYSTEAVAAALPASLLHWTVMSFALGTANYVNAFVAQYEGAGRRDRVSASVWQGVHFSIVTGLLFTLAALFARPIFDAIDHEPAVRALESQYFGILCLGTLPAVLSAALACYFSGRGQTLVILWANLAATMVNIVLDYAMIFGLGPIPAMGIAGAAIATNIAACVPAGVYVVAMAISPERHAYDFWNQWRFDRKLFGQLLRFGLPSGLHFFMDIVCFTVFILLVGKLGTEALAATNLAFNLNTLAFVPMIGFATAVVTIVGQRIGEGRPQLARRATWIGYWLATAYMAIFVVIYLVFPEAILAPYAAYAKGDEYKPVHQQVVTLLRFVAIYSLFDTMAIIFSSAIRGAGDTRFAMFFSVIGGWTLMVLPTYIGCVVYDGGLPFAWWMLTIYVIVLGIGFLLRFRGGAWMSMRVIEPAPEIIEPIVEPLLGPLAPAEPAAT